MKEELCKMAAEVRMVSNGGVAVVLFFDEIVLRLICGGGWRCNSCCYVELKGEWDMHSAGDLFVCLGD